MKMLYTIWIFLFVIFGLVSSHAQADKMVMEAFVRDEQIMKNGGVRHSALVEQVYRFNNYQFIWIPNPDQQHQLFELISSASVYGLEERDYHYAFIHTLKLRLYSMTCTSDSGIAEVLLTDAAIRFLHDIRNGNTKPDFGYDGLQYEPTFDLSAEDLVRCILTGKLDSLAFALEPKSVEYKRMKEILVAWNKTTEDTSFKELRISSRTVAVENILLIKKLRQLGVLSKKEELSYQLLLEKIRQVQKMFDQQSDGVLRSNTLRELNVPLSARIHELKMAINFVRWLDEIKQNSNIALLNIPSAQLLVFDHGVLTLNSKIIAGKPTTPTSTLASTIKEVIIYPYWNVPNSIATKELLPRIKKSVSYLGRNNYQVLNNQGKIVDPYSINWHSLSASNFPYLIRQSTGCDNALGIVKFNFYNPFSMYLHDTPSKSLFLLTRRFFSHGCMRLEKPVELARLLLQDKSSSVENLIGQCLKDQMPRNMQLENPLPLMVFYSTVWYNEQGQIRFYEDIYNKMSNRQTLNRLL
jgi:L,D-transpeptidase YcbB